MSRRSGCRIIAEVAMTHDGNLRLAHRFIDAVATTGADAIKFQAHIARAESTRLEPFRVKFSRRDKTRFDYWKRTEFTEKEWRKLAMHARRKGLEFMCSPFSVEAADMLKRVGVRSWKIGSGEIGTLPLLQRVARAGGPIYLSTGMSPHAEIHAAVRALRAAGGRNVTLMQCTSIYPCPPENLGLNQIAELRKRHGCPVGLSDHSGTIYAGLSAAALGAVALEVHVALSRTMFGPDVSSSVTVEQLADLVRGVRFIETAASHPVDKDRMARRLAPLKKIFSKSVVAARDLAAGARLTENDLTLKKPGTGLPASAMGSLVGKRLSRGVRADDQFRRKDIRS